MADPLNRNRHGLSAPESGQVLKCADEITDSP